MAQRRPNGKGRPTPPRKGPSDRVLLANKPQSHYPSRPDTGSWHAGRKETCVDCQDWLLEQFAALGVAIDRAVESGRAAVGQ